MDSYIVYWTISSLIFALMSNTIKALILLKLYNSSSPYDKTLAIAIALNWDIRNIMHNREWLVIIFALIDIVFLVLLFLSMNWFLPVLFR